MKGVLSRTVTLCMHEGYQMRYFWISMEHADDGFIDAMLAAVMRNELSPVKLIKPRSSRMNK